MNFRKFLNTVIDEELLLQTDDYPAPSGSDADVPSTTPYSPPALDLTFVHSDRNKEKPCYDERARPGTVRHSMHNDYNNNPPARSAAERTTKPETKLFIGVV